MNLAGHISELRKKHETLSKRIETEHRRPAADEFELARLKREKLKIKEAITRLSAPVH